MQGRLLRALGDILSELIVEESDKPLKNGSQVRKEKMDFFFTGDESNNPRDPANSGCSENALDAGDIHNQKHNEDLNDNLQRHVCEIREARVHPEDGDDVVGDALLDESDTSRPAQMIQRRRERSFGNT